MSKSKTTAQVPRERLFQPRTVTMQETGWSLDTIRQFENQGRLDAVRLSPRRLGKVYHIPEQVRALAAALIAEAKANTQA